MNIGATSKFLTGNLQKITNQKESNLMKFTTLKKNLLPSDDIAVTNLKLSVRNQISSLNTINTSLMQNQSAIGVINAQLDSITQNYSSILTITQQAQAQLTNDNIAQLQQSISTSLGLADDKSRTATFNGENVLNGGYGLYMQINEQGGYNVSIPSMQSTDVKLQSFDKTALASVLQNKLESLADSSGISEGARSLVIIAAQKLDPTTAEGALNLQRFGNIFEGAISLMNTQNIVGQNGVNGGLLAPLPSGMTPALVDDTTASVAQLLSKAAALSQAAGDAGYTNFAAGAEAIIEGIADVVNYFNNLSATGFSDVITVREILSADQSAVYNDIVNDLAALTGATVQGYGGPATAKLVNDFISSANTGIGAAPTSATTAPTYVSAAASAAGLLKDLTTLATNLGAITNNAIASNMSTAITTAIGSGGAIASAITLATTGSTGWDAANYNLLNNAIAYTLYGNAASAGELATFESAFVTGMGASPSTAGTAPAYVSLSSTGSTLGAGLAALTTALDAAGTPFANAVSQSVSTAIANGGTIYAAAAAAQGAGNWTASTYDALKTAVYNAINSPVSSYGQPMGIQPSTPDAMIVHGAVSQWLAAFNTNVGNEYSSGSASAVATYLNTSSTASGTFVGDTNALISSIQAVSPDFANKLSISIGENGLLNNLAEAVIANYNNDTLQALRDGMMSQVLGVTAAPIGTDLSNTLTNESCSAIQSAILAFRSTETANAFQDWTNNFATITSIIGQGNINTPGSLTGALLGGLSAFGVQSSIYYDVAGSAFANTLNDVYGNSFKMNEANNNSGLLYYRSLDISTPGRAALAQMVVSEFVEYMTDLQTNLSAAAGDASVLISTNAAIISEYSSILEGIDALDMGDGLENLVNDDKLLSTALYAFGAQQDLINKLTHKLAQ